MSYVQGDNWYLNSFHPSDTLTLFIQVSHKCIGEEAIIDLDNGLAPIRCQAII